MIKVNGIYMAGTWIILVGTRGNLAPKIRLILARALKKVAHPCLSGSSSLDLYHFLRRFCCEERFGSGRKWHIITKDRCLPHPILSPKLDLCSWRMFESTRYWIPLRVICLWYVRTFSMFYYLFLLSCIPFKAFHLFIFSKCSLPGLVEFS